MRANPGGVIGPGEVIGRDVLTKNLWKFLEDQSLLLTSERRIGKTSVLRKMENECPSDVVCILRDLEGLRSPHELVQMIYRDVEGLISRKERALLKFQGLLAKLGGTEVGDVRLPHIEVHWKALLSHLLDDISEVEPRRVVFLWDELPLFVQNVVATAGEPSGMEVLDVLRSLRQERPKLRMVFTGSVGLHQVVKALRRRGYPNDPTNDMRVVEVGPLAPDDGARLATLLLDGEDLPCDCDRLTAARSITDATGHIPFYTHWVVSRLASDGASVRMDSAQRQVDFLLTDPDDPAHFQYYRDRLHTYYSSEEEPLALNILDALAPVPEPMALQNLLALVRHRTPQADEELVRGLVVLLERDHYIARVPANGKLAFRYQIIQRWWQRHRS